LADEYIPDENWQAIKFDAPGPYTARAKAAGTTPYAAMMKHLPTAWGQDAVDYSSPTKVGSTYFFNPRVK
jgi:hypothetical protein